MNPSAKKRVLTFLLYDPQGVCDESTLYTLRGFRPFVDHLLVVSNGELQADSRTKVAEIADELLERDNKGYDVGAYRDAFSHIGWERLAEFDELLMVNYTFFGPVGSFDAVLHQMADEPVDFWGITDHPEVSPHPYLGHGTMPAHLQSFWLGVRKPILQSPDFKNYWMSLQEPQSYSDVVVLFETQFTQHFANLGYRWRAAYPSSKYGVDNPAMEAPLALLEDGCPLFKKRLYFHDAPWLAKQGVFSGAVTAEAVRRGFPEEVVVEGARRRATVRELGFGLDATYVVTDADADSEGLEAKVFVGSPWKSLVSKGVDGFLGSAEILLVDAPDPKEGQRADAVLSPLRYARAAVVTPVGFIQQIFREHPAMAAVFPYINILKEPAVGRQWVERIDASAQVAQALGLSGPFSLTSTLAPYRGVAAYRRVFLESVHDRIESAGGWESLIAKAGDERRLVRILDMLAGDMAKESGWFVGQAGTADELRRTASLLQDVYSRSPFVQPEYLDYPYSGRVMVPSIKNQVGAAIKRTAPHTFELLHSAELRMRSLAQKAVRRGK